VRRRRSPVATSRSTSFYVDEALLERISAFAQARGQTRSEVVVRAVEVYMAATEVLDERRMLTERGAA
jgi:predicted transcriptional regulator